MQNPWKNLPHSPLFVLDEDRDKINEYNKKNARTDYRINLDTLPDPYVGDVLKAPVVFLLLNPGSDLLPGFTKPTEINERKLFPQLNRDNRKNLLHQYEGKFPFYHLNPAYRLTGGFRWWAKLLGSTIKSKADYAKLSKNICSIEFFPYHSKSFKPLHKKTILASQEYNFDLVKKAISNPSRHIIILKSENHWLEKVPLLEKCRYFSPKNPRNSKLSKPNFPRHYKEILKLLHQ